MINFSHKSVTENKEKSIKLAQRMKERSKLTSNPLEYLLKKHLDTKDITRIKFSELDDFPKIKRKKIINKILYGKFHFYQAFSYIEDLVKADKVFLVNRKLNEKKDSKSCKSKIIAFEIASRHKRSQIKKILKNKTDTELKFKNPYKVFIQYVPFKNKSTAIKSN